MHVIIINEVLREEFNISLRKFGQEYEIINVPFEGAAGVCREVSTDQYLSYRYETD